MTVRLTAPRIGWALLALLLGFALFAPLADPLGPFKQSLLKALSGADAAAPFGYDHLGRSLTARLASALRLSLTIAAAAVATSAILGVAVGVLAAWRAREGSLMRMGIGTATLTGTGLETAARSSASEMGAATGWSR